MAMRAFLNSLITMGFLCIATVFASMAAAQVDILRGPLSDEIGDREVAFLARDLETGIEYVLTGSDLNTRHAPWSTFKIPNLLIALETGVAASLDHAYPWDQDRRPAAGYWPRDWRQDQTLRSAFRDSAVWVFQDIALDVGVREYRQRLGEWGYGNASVPDGSDGFWLGGPLMVSVREQVDFLDRFFMGTLALSGASANALIEASHFAQFGTATLHGKTGAGATSSNGFSGEFEGWYTGFVLRENAEPVVFSLYTRARSFSALQHFRQDFAIRLLQEAELLPGS